MTKSFSDLFRGYSAKYGVYHISNDPDSVKQKGRAITVDGPLTEEIWKRHLDGISPGIGIVPLDENNTCSFAAIDIDVYKGLDYRKIENDCKNLPVILCKSKSGGVHIYMFFEKPVKAQLAQGRMSEIAAALGFGKAEIFPKQTKRIKDEVGNWINLPYFGSTRKAFYQGSDLDLEDFLALANRRLVTEEWLAGFKLMRDGAQGEDYLDGPICLQNIVTRGIPEGTRNHVVFTAGVYFKRKYGSFNFEEKVIEFNQKHCAEPLRNQEVQTIISSVKKKDYGYECNKEPLCQFCDKYACRKREFGIGKNNDGGMNVILSNLVKIKTEPPMWRVDLFNGVDTSTVTLDTIDDLLNLRKFRILALERTHAVIPMTKQNKWDETISDLMGTLTEEDAPRDASERGQLLNHLMDFITENENLDPDARDCVLRNQVWLHDGVYYFRSSVFQNFLQQQGIKIKQRNVWSHLREIGMINTQLGVGSDRTVRTWGISKTELYRVWETDE